MTGPRYRRRRGGVLLEMIVALGIFVTTAGFVLRAIGNVTTAIERSQRRQEAVDVARSKLAELEAGLIALNDLRRADVTAIGTFDTRDTGEDPRWTIDVDTERTEWGSLVLVEVTVTEPGGDRGFDAPPGEPEPIAVTLRQLMRLREADVEDFEDDTLLEGLPTEPAPFDEEPAP